MTSPSHRARRIGALAAILGLLLTSPIWAFELAWRWLLPPLDLPPPAATEEVPQAMLEALWVATLGNAGRSLGGLWLGNYFRAGQDPVDRVALLVTLGAEPAGTASARRLRLAAAAVWLSRNAGETDLKRALARHEHFGRGATGVGAAACAYFGRPPSELTVGQMALLAGLPQSPARYDPVQNPEQAQARRLYILVRLRERGALSAEQLDAALLEPLEVLGAPGECPTPG